MLLRNERMVIVDYGEDLLASRLTTGTGGNLSIFNRKEGLIAITPSGVPYLDMQAEEVVIVNTHGEIVEGDLIPSSELSLHLALYEKRADVCAVVHTHSAFATTIACLNWELPAVHYLVGLAGTKVPLAPYSTFGTTALARNAAGVIGHYQAVLLANHGLVAVGPDLPTAFSVAEEVELVAQVYYQAKCIGEPVILEDKEMSEVIERLKSYGQPEPPLPDA